MHPSIQNATKSISIHPPRAGRDHYASTSKYSHHDFNPPAPCGAGHQVTYSILQSPLISIHPPRAGRDNIPYVAGGVPWRISIHPPRAGRDDFCFETRQGIYNFNPPAPCGAGLRSLLYDLYYTNISIHPPRAGRDQWQFGLEYTVMDFNPPAPCGAGHAPLITQKRSFNFNPPAPCGAGLIQPYEYGDPWIFQSTRPVRGGTADKVLSDMRKIISIHPPRAGRDVAEVPPIVLTCDFNPPAPCGAGLMVSTSSMLLSRFQSTRPVRGGTGAEC